MTPPTSPLPTTIAGTALGPVEYLDLGPADGPVVLTVHGSPGGCDAAELMGRFLVARGFRVIAPSRPGYLGTPLSPAVATPSQQAALLVALLDHLGIDRVGVLSWSGGGPCGYRMAAEFGDRVRSLVAFAALSGKFDWQLTWIDRMTFSSWIGVKLMKVFSSVAPRTIVSGTLASEGDLTKEEVTARTATIMADPDLLDFVLTLTRTATMRGARREGVQNDTAQFLDITSLELGTISVPTLVVQGDADSDVNPSFSRAAIEQIPGAASHVIPGGTHLGLYVDPGYQEAQEAVASFLGQLDS